MSRISAGIGSALGAIAGGVVGVVAVAGPRAPSGPYEEKAALAGILAGAVLGAIVGAGSDPVVVSSPPRFP